MKRLKRDMEAFVRCKDAYVRGIAAKSSPFKEHLDVLIKDEDGWVRVAVATNPNAAKEHLDFLIKDKVCRVKEAVARYSPYKEHLGILVNDTDWRVRAAVAKNPIASKE